MKQKSTKRKPQEETSINLLKKVAKRVEDATIDIGEMKRSLRFVNLRLGQVERNTDLMKVDVEKIREEMGEMKKDIREVKRNTEGLIGTTGHILKEAVTHDEHNTLSQRVTALEQS